MPDKIYLVSCVSQKLPQAAAARDLYVSAWFRKARTLVEEAGGPWFVLSAEHGLIEPGKIISPYNRTLAKISVHERRAWGERVTSQMEAQLPALGEVILLAGYFYRQHLMPWLEARYPSVSVPMEGLTIGRQLRWLNNVKTH